MILNRLLLVLTLVPSSQAQAPAVLPGHGLAEHDFLYAGESHDRRIFLIRHGQVVWSYDDPAGKGELSDAVLLSNGNILFAHQFGVELITPEKKVLWHYEPPPNHEVHTAIPIGTTHVLYIQNGDPAVLRVVNLVTGAVERELPLATKQPVSVHAQFRHARLTSRGTLLVAHMDLGKLVEYDAHGTELQSIPIPGIWGVTPLANGHILVTTHTGVRELTATGDLVWSWTPADTPDYKFANLQQAWRLANGDTVINNWSNEWTPSEATAASSSIQVIEVTPANKVMWALRQWSNPNLGPATTLQFLDQKAPAFEAVHFGDIH